MNRREFLTTSAIGAGTLAAGGCATDQRDVLVGSDSLTPSASAPVYELRVYHINPGKAEDLHNRFRHHTLSLFAHHHIESIGYWMPIDPADQRLHFLLRYPSREAREESWKTFMADPQWQAAYKASEANGGLVSKVENSFLVPTDYSPRPTAGNVSKGGVFELRTYTTPPGRLPNLDSRFRDHTIGLFTRHGMKNWLYLHKMPDQPDSDVTLVYFLIHASPEAARVSFAEFGADPEWKRAREDSEKTAGGSLTVPNGVKSVFLKPTDFSPTR